ncbi:MAG: glycogen synthase [Deltaproteobacteria bacterium]|nr:glycogen synthase [Deltaproteobacteria bacterium]
MRIAFVSSEAVPFSKVGGLADVVGSLPPVLADEHNDLTIYLPGRGREGGKVIGERTFSWKGQEEKVEVRRLEREGVRYRFVDLPDFRGRPVYEGDAADLVRYTRYCLAVDADLRHRPAQVVHLHDWPTALIAVLLKNRRSRVQCVFTIHNLAYQGFWEADAFYEATGLPRSLHTPEGLEFFGKVNLLKGALVFADAITTVSPTYAREIQSRARGEGLDGVLRHHGGKLTGVLNGIDTRYWDPATDPHLPANYESIDDPGKQACRVALGRELHLSGPILGVISRLFWQKGIDIVLDALPRLLEMGYDLCILGSGEPVLERQCQAAADNYPGRVVFRRGYDEPLAHRIYAGAEAFLMPSRWEPCGLSQLIAMRYGTVPVVRATGGLFDTVIDGQTGIRFECAHPEGLIAGLSRLAHGPLKRDVIGAAGMKREVGWRRAAQAYRRIYGIEDQPLLVDGAA